MRYHHIWYLERGVQHSKCFRLFNTVIWDLGGNTSDDLNRGYDDRHLYHGW